MTEIGDDIGSGNEDDMIDMQTKVSSFKDL